MTPQATHSTTMTGGAPAPFLPGPAARRTIVAGLLVAAVGLGTGCALGFQDVSSRRLFFHAYLVAFAYYLSLTLGALLFVLLQHLTRAGWSVTLRRPAEGLCGNVGLLLLLFLPIVVWAPEIYEWSHAEFAAQGGVSSAKAAYLSTAAFAARFALYFAVWGWLARFLRSRSIRQDASGDAQLSLRLERASAPGMIALSFTMLFAAVDLLMSQSSHWYSTIFGVYFFTGCAVGSFAALALLAVWLRGQGEMDQFISIEHLHDLGKFMFAFVVFWGYIAFSQYMLIWYANLPEETAYYQPRQSGQWAGVSLALLACQLVIPLLGLLPRWAKRVPLVLAFWSLWLLAAHLLDVFWLVMPSGQSAPLEGRTIAMVLALAVGMGGLVLANTARLLRGASLVPVGDPRLPESLAFENE